SLEVELPFLQRVTPHAKIVPLAGTRAEPEVVGRALETLWGGPETLIVISSDLSHYLRYEPARAADQATVRRILALDPGLGPHEACGAAAINGALLAARRHGLAPRLLALCNSGDTAGDRNRVVGYGAIAFEEPQR
ncbi:MAG: AmmeMemoRadiSam system protein B, partial [Caldimonas sp.]